MMDTALYCGVSGVPGERCEMTFRVVEDYVCRPEWELVNMCVYLKLA